MASFSPEYNISNSDKKPSHPNEIEVAGSILKIFITIQKGKDFIAHQETRHTNSEKHISQGENKKNHQHR